MFDFLGMWILPVYLVALAAVGRVILWLIDSGGTRFRRGYVTGVTGRMGSGKTLFMMHRAYDHLKRGGVVACNGTLDLRKAGLVGRGARVLQFTGWAQAARLPKGTLVLLDEAHLYAPALSGFRLPEEARWYLSMARKLGHEIVWATQHEKRVSESLRAQTSCMVKCINVGGMWHKAKVGCPDTFGQASWKPWWNQRYRRTKRVCALYDTYQLIQADDSADKTGVIAELIAHHRTAGTI